MKKITLFFMAVSTIFTAWAQQGTKITDLSQLSNNKCYTILPADNGRGTWVYNPNTPNKLHSTAKLTNQTVNPNDPNQQFAFLKSATGNYYIYNVGSKKFLQYNADGTCDLVAEPQNTNATAALLRSNHAQKANYPWVAALNGHQIGISNGYTYGVITSYNDLADGGNSISITEQCAFESTSAMEIVTKIDQVEVANTIFSIPANAVGWYDATLVEALNKVCGNDHNADFTDIQKPEFKTALDAVLNSKKKTFTAGKLYKIQNMVASNGCLTTRTEAGKSRLFSSAKAAVQGATDLAGAEYWQVYNKYGFTYLYNNATKTYAKNVDGNNWVLSETPTELNIIQNASNNSATFVIQDKNKTDAAHLLHFNLAFETGITGWYMNDNKTNFYFIEQTQAPDAVVDPSNHVASILRAKAQNMVDTYDPLKSNYVGSPTINQIDVLKKKLKDFPNLGAEELYWAIESVKSNATRIQPENYYMIQNTFAFNDKQSKVISENQDGTNIAWGNKQNNATELWQFEAGPNGTYYIKSANTGKYIDLELGNTRAHAVMNTNKPTPFTLVNQNDPMVWGLEAHLRGDKSTLALMTGQNFGNLANASATEGNFAGTYNSYAADKPTKWNIVSVGSINVTIGSAKYATLWLPFNVNLNNQKVTVYIVKATNKTGTANGTAILEEVIGGVIPANTPVIISGEPATYSFPLLKKNVSINTNNNLLLGTNIRTAILADKNAYILGNGTAGVGFYKMNAADRNLAANKAYIELPDAQANVLSIIIGGQTTGIKDAVTETAEEVYFDLQGRRVQNPTKGIYVTKSGKKVLFY